MNFFKPAIFAMLAMAIMSCERNRTKVNLSSVKEEVKIIRFENEMFALGTSPDSFQIEELYSKYPEFSPLFFYQVVHMGHPSDPSGQKLMHEFLNDSVILDIKKKTEWLFPEQAEFQKKLVRAFRYNKFYFPEDTLPVIYTCISGFNESVFTDGRVIGISLDKYIGADCAFYPLLGFTNYKKRRMIPEMIPADVVYTWGMTRFPLSNEATTLLDHMVHEGKLLFLCDALLPDMADSLITGFTLPHLKWCSGNEGRMWNYLVEQKLLFSTKQMDIVRYTGDGPTTNGFPPESPARTGNWLGWQIVKSYMKRHPEITLSQLMSNNNYLEILNTSAYAPQ